MTVPPPPMNGMNENVLANHFSAGRSFGTEHEHAPQPVDHGRAPPPAGRPASPAAPAQPARAQLGENSAAATATGTPMTSAIAEVISVPTTSGAPW